MNPQLNFCIRLSCYIFAFLIFIALGVVFQVLQGYVDPVVNGFYCNDQTILYPLLQQLIPEWLTYVIVILTPLTVIFGGTMWDLIRMILSTNPIYTTREKIRKFLDWLIWSVWCLNGLALTYVILSILRITSGELRPHFISACQPNISQITCQDQFGLPKFVTNYTCLGTPEQVRHARLSFPSQHSAVFFYSMVYSALHLASVNFLPPRSPLQYFLIVMFGVLTPFALSMTQVIDYHSHLHDIIIGAIIGIIFAFIVVYFNTYYFDRWKEWLTGEEEMDSHEAAINVNAVIGERKGRSYDEPVVASSRV